MQQLNIELFKECCALTFSVQRWSNRKTVKVGEAEASEGGVDASRVRKTLRLTTAKEYKLVCDFQNDTKRWVVDRSMPSFFKAGIYMVKLSEIDAICAKIDEATARLREDFIPALVTGILNNETVDRQALGAYYSLEDYPNDLVMPKKFGFTYLPISFGVPENLPQRLFEESKAKTEAMWKDAQEKILQALRMSFAGLIDHAVERLKVEPGDKVKVFKSSTIENIRGFLETFDAKNLMNDAELANFVKKAEEVMLQVDGDTDFSELMRSDEAMRSRIASQFEDIKAGVNDMITNRPARRFDMSADVDED